MRTRITCDIDLTYILESHRKELGYHSNCPKPNSRAYDEVFMVINTDNHLLKRVLGAHTRVNLNISVSNGRNEEISVISIINELNRIDEKFELFLKWVVEYQELLCSHTKDMMFPAYKANHPEILEDDWIEQARLVNKSISYRTNLWRDSNIDESLILEKFQEAVDKGFDKYITLKAGFCVWGYFGNDPIPSLQEFINIRHKNLK